MNEPTAKLFDKKKFAIAFIISLIIGLIPALFVSRETSGYVAGMTYGILIVFCGLPFLVFTFILIFAAALKNNAQYSIIFLMGLFLVPISFGVSVKLMEATGISLYSRPGVDDIRPIGSELNERIFIAFKESASNDEIQKFDETVLRKSVPKPNGVMLAFADLICGIMYPNTEFKQQVADIGFCNGATIEQKKMINKKANSSSIVFQVFEAVRMDEIKTLPLSKKVEIPDNIQRKAITKTVSNGN